MKPCKSCKGIGIVKGKGEDWSKKGLFGMSHLITTQKLIQCPKCFGKGRK